MEQEKKKFNQATATMVVAFSFLGIFIPKQVTITVIAID